MTGAPNQNDDFRAIPMCCSGVYPRCTLNARSHDTHLRQRTPSAKTGTRRGWLRPVVLSAQRGGHENLTTPCAEVGPSDGGTRPVCVVQPPVLSCEHVDDIAYDPLTTTCGSQSRSEVVGREVVVADLIAECVADYLGHRGRGESVWAETAGDPPVRSRSGR